MKLTAAFLVATLFAAGAGAVESVSITVDFAHTLPPLKPLHGINKGPLAPGGLIDVTADLRELRIPFIRLHDCHWPNPDVVDIHTVFPDFDADSERQESYDFKRTDEYIAAARATGAELIYRLGESIEHTTDKRFVHPPRDAAKWAAICAGIVRHYNEGWAHGFHYGIRYWEIWNEPENRPVCWTGTDEQYFELYRVTSRALKQRWPDLKIGGPAVGNSGSEKDGHFVPTDFVRGFLKMCRTESLPLDFFSWHRYKADPAAFAQRARDIRALLDAEGFAKTESHLNEWNFLPGDTWGPVLRNASARDRSTFYRTMAGPTGAAFLVDALRQMHDAPIDVANLFHGELGGFGLFDEYGVPQANYYGLLAYRRLLDTPLRVDARGALAGVNKAHSQASILFAHRKSTPANAEIECLAWPWKSPIDVTIWIVDSEHPAGSTTKRTLPPGESTLRISLSSESVVLVTLLPK